MFNEVLNSQLGLPNRKSKFESPLYGSLSPFHGGSINDAHSSPGTLPSLSPRPSLPSAFNEVLNSQLCLPNRKSEKGSSKYESPLRDSLSPFHGGSINDSHSSPGTLPSLSPRPSPPSEYNNVENKGYSRSKKSFKVVVPLTAESRPNIFAKIPPEVEVSSLVSTSVHTSTNHLRPRPSLFKETNTVTSVADEHVSNHINLVFFNC